MKRGKDDFQKYVKNRGLSEERTKVVNHIAQVNGQLALNDIFTLMPEHFFVGPKREGRKESK